MVPRVYLTANSEYPVSRMTPDGGEVISRESGGSMKDYEIIGFVDPEKLERTIIDGDGYWSLRSSGKHLGRNGELEAELEKDPRPGLRIVAWLVDTEDNRVGPHSGSPDEMRTSALGDPCLRN
jgi:hypothetical protein